jgi:PAS domain S-box-containing protein
MFLSSSFASAQENPIALTEAELNWLNQKHTVRVRVGNWPPFIFTDDKIQGIAIDYLESVFQRHGIKFKYITDKEIMWKDALAFIREHKTVDMVPTAKITNDRKKYMIFTDEYLFLPWVIFTRKDSPFIGTITDLKGKTVSVPDGYVMHTLLKTEYPEINLKVYRGGDTTNQCMQMLASGLVDAYVGNLAAGTYIIQSQGYNNLKVAAPTPFGNHNQAMAIRDDWPQLAGIINKTWKNFSPEEHTEILSKWLSIRYEHGIRPRDVLKWVFGVASVLILILSIILFWNRTLNKEITERQKIEEKLRESENKYRSLSDAAFEGIAISRQGIIVEANDCFAKMLGHKTEELLGKNSLEFVAPKEIDNVASKMSSSYEQQYESTFLRKDGSTFLVEIQAKMFSYKGEKVRVSAVRDITQRKQAEEEIKRLRGILPLCSYCKKVRDDKGYWEQVDIYIHKHSEADISHSICPECMKKHYSEVYEDINEEK